MEPQSDHLKEKSSPDSSRSLLFLKHEILETWEVSVREEIKEGTKSDRLAVRKHISNWLDQLIDVLDPQSPLHSTSEGNRLGQKVGLHHAILQNFSLPDLIKQFSLLRRAILAALDSRGQISFTEISIINDSIDNVLSLAANEYSNFQRAQVELALRESEKSNRDLEHFAAIAAHDLKSPLATMTGYIELLQEEFVSKDPQADELFEVVANQSRRMLALIDRLLEYARLRGHKPQFTQVHLSEIADIAIQNVQATMKERSAVVQHEKLPTIRGDATLLIQAFQNLIANGLKFNQRVQPEVKILCKSDDEKWVIQFQDNGIGFDPKEKEIIFQPHKQLRKNEYQGAGLGLATVQRVVELHKGRVTAQSQPGKGSVFSIELPKS
ncbi:MAG: ATP-binding protein [Pseudobdellovibrionaceae bacterium]